MRESFSTWAIRNPIPPIVLFMILTIAGVYAFTKMPITNMPAVVIPVVTVTITQPGAAPLEMETQITKKIEGALAGVQGVKHITSTVNTGTSVTAIEFTLETSFDRAVNDTRDAVSNIRDQMPRSILEPIIQRIEMDGGPVVDYTVQAPDLSTEDLSWFIDDFVARELLSIRGVASVERRGGIDHEITVSIDRDRLAAFGVTASDISQRLAMINVDLPGGRLTLNGTEYTLRTLASAKTVSDIGKIEISLSNGSRLKLSDVATITDGGAEPRSITKLNGKPVVSFSVFRSKGASEVTVAAKVVEKLKEIEETHKGVTFKKLFSVAEFTETSFKSTVYTFFEGALLTIIVVFIFLRDRRSTVIAAIAIPLSIIPTFLFMYLLGFGLNGVSLLAISLVTGVLVDDAIVEIENIHRHMKEGKTPYDAAMIAADEIGLAVVATTLVVCSVFLPVSFMPGISGQFFKQFGLTVAIAAFFSLIVARLLTPMLAAYLLKNNAEHENKTADFWLGRYKTLVEWTLAHRLQTLALAIMTMVLSFSMIPLLKSGFIPYEDYSQSTLSVELPRGTTLEQTDAVAQEMAEIVRKARPEVLYVLTSVGEISGGVNQAKINIKLLKPDQRDLEQREIEAELLPLLKKVPDVRVAFENVNGQKDISIVLQSENTQALEKAAENLNREMREMAELSSIENSAGQRQPEIIIVPDYDKAAMLGIDAQQISQAINIAMIGDIESNLAKFNQGTRQIPIRVLLAKQNYASLDVISNIKLASKTGNAVPLSSVATLHYGTGPTTIERYDRLRKIAIEANLNKAALGDMLEKIHNLPSIKNLPPDVKVQNTGDAEIMAELFEGFMSAIVAGLLMVYAVQVLLYKDWLQPITRMAALPLSIGGAFFMLLITGTEFNLPAIIGILMLMGIADKNAILLVDYMLERIHAGMPKREAIIESCIVRARPIVMTTLAMLAGMIVIAVGLGLDTAFRAPMAIAVAGGLISSTILSLVFVPVLFSFVRDFEEWLVPKLKRII